MTSRTAFLLASLLGCAVAQTLTLSGCHFHDGQEYCLLPDGSEVPFTRTGSATATPVPPTTRPATVAASPTSAAVPASVTGCHTHGSAQFCLGPSGTEYEVLQTPDITPLPESYNGCHEHGGGEIYCKAPDGSEVQIVQEGTEHAEAGHTHEHADEHAGEHAGEHVGEHAAGEAQATAAGRNCHYHGDTLHCTGGASLSCESVDHDYNTGLRIGMIFVILITSGFAVFAPLLLERFSSMKLNSVVFVFLKQFGTGVIISTAFIHLLTHAEMQFSNECLGALSYESTATAIAMAGTFLCFLVEYTGARLIAKRNQTAPATVDSEQLSTSSKEAAHVVPRPVDNSIAALGHSHGGGLDTETHFSVAVMESGIIFHSILIGVTLNVTPNSFYTTFLIVILFHQMFEGLALGTRIAALKSSTSFWIKSSLAGAFTLITPIGMAIGVGVLSKFNGNDPATIIAIGTLDAVSAGILLWVGLVEMLAHDWMGGDMARAGWFKGLIGGASLVAGMILMSVLGKWA
ncbi:zinc/iron transporter [Diplocarpon rosae]|nr:zinc/iron transporter [Diplocarpon rosae]